MQTRVKRRCLGCVLYSLMHRYARPAYRGSASDASADLPGARASLRGLISLEEPRVEKTKKRRFFAEKSAYLGKNRASN